MTAASKWEDLKTRSASSLLMVAVGAGEIWLGGSWFLALIVIACGLMIWELVRLVARDAAGLALGLGLLAGASVLGAILLKLPVLLVLPVLLGGVAVSRHRVMYLLYAPVVMAGAYGLVMLRDTPDGLTWLIWLVLVVVVTDVAGYFAGRMIGGPKFWPAISPKKTWSGTVAGWIGAGALGLAFQPLTGAGVTLVVVSMIASFASQMGDIAESAVKRRTGVKDSSSLIPGHGGVLDRFDGLLGASLLVLLFMVIAGHLPDQP